MSFLTGSPKNSWQPVMTADTTTASYWLNWRVLICTVWLLLSLVFASLLISKHERLPKTKHGSRDMEQHSPAILYEDDVWRPCLRSIHPGWLLAYRIFAFSVLLLMLILNVAIDGGDIMYFYTQWTFTLITVYFGLGIVLSIYGCFQHQNKVGGERIGDEGLDVENGAHGTSMHSEISNVPNAAKSLGPNEERPRQVAGFWGYVFQIIFQMNAGAVMLTDCVFWFIIVPFLTIKDYNLNFLIINMHSINAVFLLGETALNCLRFPWFRIAYFLLWTTVYVVFQWVVHACISLWWPYPFLDLSSPLAPIWYLSVALMHVPCYGLFVLVIKMKQCLLSKWFPQTYQCPR